MAKVKTKCRVEEEENYSIDEVLGLMIEELNALNIKYIVEEINNETKIIWLDKDNNFGCEIIDGFISTSHLKGSAPFNLSEGKKIDLLTISDVVNHLNKISVNELHQIEVYKWNKLCSVKQYIIVDGQKNLVRLTYFVIFSFSCHL